MGPQIGLCNATEIRTTEEAVCNTTNGGVFKAWRSVLLLAVVQLSENITHINKVSLLLCLSPLLAYF